MTIDSIGWQIIRSPEYSFYGDDRPDTGHVIFQYTISGQGYLDFEGRSYSLSKGTAFLVKVPSRHRYYYEPHHEPWEILWLNLRGEEANRIWNLVIEQEGPLLKRASGSPLILELWTLLRMIGEEKVTDKYLLSAKAYEWMLTLVRTSKEQSKDISITSSTIVECAKKYMREHYASPITLELLSEHCGINKYHLCRLFQKSIGITPLSYLRERRVEAALSMLRATELPIQEIGRLCGFESPSYFGKVFREYMSMTPKEYRLKKLEFPYVAIYYE
ncbi:AraC family transcriptional regulator [Paenibacillus soyae]|uniref:AraC family transcriptional regulator n=1 Tax=Paenibacillus soyae TaxID=2969249 RepID=A0A9X2S7G2_9BACL|nr:AraC family transcriptional regulator [Paenibacillus soyae]MCR2803284.1 AraC family transcriptional regulator [Paenibacillus soyae]